MDDGEEPTVKGRAWGVAGCKRFVSLLPGISSREVALGVWYANMIIKRSRREVTPRERSPIAAPRERRVRTPPKVPAKEEPAVHSGSEEGEIEEE